MYVVEWEIFIKMKMVKWMPLVSIIVPVYNVERYVSECLDSVINQSLYDIEIICINDGSTDDSIKIIQNYADLDARIHILDYGRNEGVSFARNRGIEAARGKYICFLDPDDALRCDALEKLYIIAENDALDLVFFDMECCFETNELRNKYNYQVHLKVDEKNVFNGTELFQYFSKHHGHTIAARLELCRKTFILDNNLFFNEKALVSEDILFYFQTILLARRIKCICQPYYIYNRREDSLTTSGISVEKIKSYFVVYCEMVDFFKKIKVDRRYENCIARYIIRFKQFIKNLLRANNKNIDINNLCFSDSKYSKSFAIFKQEYMGCHQRILSRKMIEYIRESNIVIIYGAGIIGESVATYLRSLGINKYYFAVTHAGGNEFLFGNKVYSIKELQTYNKESVVLLSTSLKYQKEIIGTLDELGFKTIIKMV